MEALMTRQVLRVRWVVAAIGAALTIAGCKSGGGY
jgi:hypothetical protein